MLSSPGEPLTGAHQRCKGADTSRRRLGISEPSEHAHEIHGHGDQHMLQCVLATPRYRDLRNSCARDAGQKLLSTPARIAYSVLKASVVCRCRAGLQYFVVRLRAYRQRCAGPHAL